MSVLRFCFNCNDTSLDHADARALVEPLGPIVNESDALNSSFLVETTQKRAEAFQEANQQWAVSAERFVPKPGPARPRILK